MSHLRRLGKTIVTLPTPCPALQIETRVALVQQAPAGRGRDIPSAPRPGEAGERIRRLAGHALVQFHVPQWMRLKDTFNRLSASRELPTSWG